MMFLDVVVDLSGWLASNLRPFTLLFFDRMKLTIVNLSERDEVVTTARVANNLGG